MYSILEVPFHMGLEAVAVGRGPLRLVRAGADRVLSSKGVPAPVSHIRPRDSTAAGLDAVVDINRQLALAVRQAREQEELPVVLAGNCNSCLGTLAGCADVERLGIVWLDAHPDFHSPETSRSGFLDGMALAAATGSCHAELRERIGYESPVEEQNVVLIGVRDVEEGERERLENSWISVHPADSRGLVPVALDELSRRVDGVYFHIDIDFVEGKENPGVNFRGPGGLAVPDAVALIRLVRASVPVAAVGLTNYNADLDAEGQTEAIALELLGALTHKLPS